jgi:hypothetical protein
VPPMRPIKNLRRRGRVSSPSRVIHFWSHRFTRYCSARKPLRAIARNYTGRPRLLGAVFGGRGYRSMALI